MCKILFDNCYEILHQLIILFFAYVQEQRDEIQSNILLRIGQVDTLPSVENAAKNGLSRDKKLPNSAPASIAPPSDSTVSKLYAYLEWENEKKKRKKMKNGKKHASCTLEICIYACKYILGNARRSRLG